MQTLFGSLVGLFATPQLHAIILLGVLVLGIFKPERIGSWPTFRLSMIFLILAISLPGLAALLPSDPSPSSDANRWILQFVLSAGGILTGVSIYCLVTCLSTDRG